MEDSNFQILKIQQKEDQIDLNEYIGINIPIVNPFHFYLSKNDLNNDKTNLSKNDLNDEKDVIRWISYVAGAQKILMWGKYYTKNQKFQLSDACRYSVKYLSKYMEQWKKTYSFAYESIKNRFHSRIQDFLGNVPFIKNYEMYVDLKYFLSTTEDSKLYKQKLNKKILDKRDPENIEKFKDFIKHHEKKYQKLLDESELSDNPDDFEEEIYKANPIRFLEDQLEDYERHINVKAHVIKLDDIKEISDKFYDYIKLGKFSSNKFYENLEECPTTEDCYLISIEGCTFFYGDDSNLQ